MGIRTDTVFLGLGEAAGAGLESGDAAETTAARSRGSIMAFGGMGELKKA
jgi:hypothetical protein